MEVSGRACLVSRVVRSVVVGAVVGLLCVGCSDDEPRPKMAPPPSATPTVSEAPPVDPTPTQATEVLGPEETVRAWVAARNEALTDGDVEAVTALSQSQCSSCENLISPIVETYERGGRYMTAGWSVLRTKAAS
ncbi:DUF6318 family protein [Nocardioides psychrotolerans]|nr:DUF6318 family protein [Nocardioides psychrotolerans]